MITDSRLSILFDIGLNAEGMPIYKTKSFNNVKMEATDEQLSAIVDALTPLQQYTVEKVERTNVYSI